MSRFVEWSFRTIPHKVHSFFPENFEIMISLSCDDSNILRVGKNRHVNPICGFYTEVTT